MSEEELDKSVEDQKSINTSRSTQFALSTWQTWLEQSEFASLQFWAEFGYGKYLIVPFWYASVAYQARLVSPWVFLARLRLAKIRTMARPNSPDMTPKRTKKVRLGI